MAATVTPPKMESGMWLLVEGDDGPITMRTKWRATLLADGTLAEVTIDTPWVGDHALNQSDWDAVWADVLAAYDALYANAPVVPPTNPIVI